MKILKHQLFLMLFFAFWQISYAQNNQGRFSGSLEAAGNFFMADESIDAVNTPQYDHQLYGADSWLNLNYSNFGFDAGIRFDLFNNSYLLNPKGSYTDQGLGRWFIKKSIHNLEISGGYLYDEIGSGIIFRAYEERPLAIDNALYGLRLKYNLTDDWQIKVFTGKQKKQFESYGSILKGLSIDGFIAGKESKWSMAPGMGIVNRTIDDETMEKLVNTLSTYTLADSIGAVYNTYAFSIFNTLTVGKVSWYIEGAYKTPEVFFDPLAEKLNWNGEKSSGKFVNKSGSVVYSTLSYAKKGFGITLEGKRTENFSFRTDPFATLNRGMLNFLPPMTRVNSMRLLSRYNAATQELGEMAFQADARYAIKKNIIFNVNFSNITNLENDLLYREIYTELLYKFKRKWVLTTGLQLQNYNQQIYEGKVNVPLVKTVTPFIEYLYRFSRKKSLNLEVQYMSTKQDYGSWIFGLAEYSIAPHWAFAVSDMYNIQPSEGHKEIHYPRIDLTYKFKSNRFSLSYVKQVKGVVCTGGICREEPAFSGVKLSVFSSF